MSKRFVVWLALVAIGATSAGCTPEVHRYKRFPDFLHPGWANQQRNDAVAHDPYLVDDAGPEVVGGRPREYQRPLNEVERARMGVPPPIGLPPIPIPAVPTGPPVVTTPYPPSPMVAPPVQVQPRSPY